MDGTLAAPWKSGASAPCLSEVEWAAVAATYLTLSFRARRRRARNLLFPAFEMDRVERTLLSAALDLTFLPCATKKWMERWQSRKRAALQRPALSEVEWAAVAATYLTLSFRARRRRARNLLFPAFEMDHVERTLLSAALDLTFLPCETKEWMERWQHRKRAALQRPALSEVEWARSRRYLFNFVIPSAPKAGEEPAVPCLRDGPCGADTPVRCP